ncbi:MAG: ComEC/Rec2 family competence protein [Amoebophilaceae bacterium]|nr:ComEC/Rec2 family competence protein [Amoebophilaceae bacterium]
MLGILLISIGYMACFLLKKSNHPSFLGSLGLVLLLLISYGSVWLHNACAAKENFALWLEDRGGITAYAATVEKVYKTAPNGATCRAAVTHIKNHSEWYATNGSTYLCLAQKKAYSPKPGDQLLIRGQPNKNSPTLMEGWDFIALKPPLGCWQSHRAIQQWCIKQIAIYVKHSSAIALIEALLFNDKEQLHPTLRAAYAKTGTIHALAVSGLHVGMLYIILHTPLRWLFNQIRWSISPTLFVLLLLWYYTWLCQYGPPVLRATIMTTMAKCGWIMGRATSSYHTIFVSAFLLLVWDPWLLFSCSFQLSYVATLAILYLHPHLYRAITIPNYGLQKLWHATSLSIAAQVGTMPLMLYYFKQFPLYFILANWIVVPSIFVILILSLILIISSPMPLISQLIGYLLDRLILLTNSFVHWVASWPLSIIETDGVDRFSVGLLYGLLIATYLFFTYKQLLYGCMVSLFIGLHALKQILSIRSTQYSAQLICYNNQGLTFTLKDATTTIHAPDDLQQQLAYIRHSPEWTTAAWHGKLLVAVNKLSPDWYGWNSQPLSADYLLIPEDLLKDIEILTKVFKVKTLVVYGKEARRLTPTCKKMVTQLAIAIIWLKPNEQQVSCWKIEEFL